MTAEDRELIDWLRDIEAAAALIERYTAQASYSTFVDSELVAAIVTLNLQVMGEAARYVTTRHPAFAQTCDLPLGAITMIRNRLIHGYFTIRQAVVWETARDDIPDVLRRVRLLIAAEENQ